MPGIFVTATGTDVGKTYVTAALIRAGCRAGLAMDALKPILTGFDDGQAAQSDAGLLLDALGRPMTPDLIAEISPWRFAAPLSPNMAARLEDRDLDFEAIVDACRGAIGPDRLTLIEGIGGVMVPLDDRNTVLDLITTLALPVVLVTGSALGALSHCLTACEVLGTRGHPPVLIVLNESPGSTVSLDATHGTLARFNDKTPIFVIPRDAGPDVHDALLAAVLALPGLCAAAELRHKRRTRV